MSRVHVLMCCHNGEAFVAEQLQSILDQQLPIDFVHVHDFGSRDATVLRVQAVAARSPVPVLLQQHDLVPGASRSFFIALELLADKLGEHDFVFLADQDDVWLSNKTTVMMCALKSDDDAVAFERLVFHDVRVVNEKLDVLRETYYPGRPFALPRDLHPDRLLLANPVIGHTMAVSAPLLRRFVRMAQPQGYLMHDWALVLFASRFGKLVYVPQVLSLYRQHSANVLGAYGRRRPSEVLRNVWRFSDAVVQQAFAFTRDISLQADTGLRRSNDDRSLARCAIRRPLTAYVRLSISALVRGPTLQRKGLFIFIAAQGLRRFFFGTSEGAKK